MLQDYRRAFVKSGILTSYIIIMTDFKEFKWLILDSDLIRCLLPVLG